MDQKQYKPTQEDVARKDEYLGKYKPADQGVSLEQKFGMSQNPVKHDELPVKNLKSVGA